MVEVAAGPSDSATHEKVSVGPAFPPPLDAGHSFAAYSSFRWC